MTESNKTEPSIDQSKPASSASAGRLETLLCSPYWPLGSSFLKLLNFPPAFRNNFLLGGTSTTISQSDDPKPETSEQHEPDQLQLDLDGSPIQSDGDISEKGEQQSCGHQDEEDDDDHALEQLLVQPKSFENRNSTRKPSLSERLTEPSTYTQRPYADKSYRDYDYRHPSRPPFSSIPRNTNFHIKGRANLKGPNHPSEPFRSSSNLIECNTKLHPWGSKRPNSVPSGPQSSNPYTKRARLSESSQKSGESKQWARDRYQASDDEQDDRRLSAKTHSQEHRWSNWHQKSEQFKQKSFAAPTSHKPEPQSRPSTSNTWTRPGFQTRPTKQKGRNNTSKDFHAEVADRERRWMQEFKQYDVAHTAHTHSVSPCPSSHERSPSRNSPDSGKDYYTLTKIPPDVEGALHRAVFSWVNRAVAEALFRVGLWLEEKGIWAPNEWGSIRVDHLEQIVDLTYERGLGYMMWRCNSTEFMELLQKPIHSGIFRIHKGPQNDAWYIKFCKDYKPIGLLYRPIIRGCRKHRSDSKTQQPIQVGKFLRQYIMSYPYEDELLYLFQDDKDHMECLKRAEKDGIIELTDQPFYQGPVDNRRGITFGNKTRNEETHIENQYIRLKPYWITNKEPTDSPLLSSPTITAQTCNTAQPDEDEVMSSISTSKTSQRNIPSNQTDNHQGENLAPVIDRRNSDNTSVSANTACTTTDIGNKQSHPPPLGHNQDEGPSSHMSDVVETLKQTNQNKRFDCSNVDELVQSIIDRLRLDVSKRHNPRSSKPTATA